MNRIEAPVVKEHFKSIKLLKKFGFKHEGTLKERIFSKGAYRDEYWLALLKKEF
jgi:RimJ/RimL family protein N-acetyltransferase